MEENKASLQDESPAKTNLSSLVDSPSIKDDESPTNGDISPLPLPKDQQSREKVDESKGKEESKLKIPFLLVADNTHQEVEDKLEAIKEA